MWEVKVKMMQSIHTFGETGHPKSSSVIPGAQGSVLTPPHPKDENIFRVRREAWSKAQAPTPNPATTNPAVTSPTKH